MLPILIAGLAQGAPWVIGIAQLHRLDLLPAYRRSVTVGSVTSYDRSGGNDDGFSGKYSFVAKEGDNLVLADLKGPGCIYRFHTPTPTDDIIDFYFDGEPKPRISMPCRDLFTGKVAPFKRPLVDYAGGGYYSYVPLPFRKSCRILLHAKSFQFYDLNYATYPNDAPIETFDMAKEFGKDYDLAAEVFDLASPNTPVSYNMPPETRKIVRQSFDVTVTAGATTVFQTRKPGRIGAIRIGPAEALESKDRDLYLRITWDGDKRSAVLCPLGDFFGYAWGKPAAGSRLLGTRDGMNYCYLPMPFDKGAKIEVVSRRALPVSLHGDVVYGDVGRRDWEGKFYAVWNRENPTTPKKDYTFFESPGRGQIVGLALQSQGQESGGTGFFEGDDMTMIDGNLAIHGTGSEDFFNGGWYDVPGRWDAPVARALSGCMAYQKPLGRTGAYRFFIGDAYGYSKSIRQTIEHGGQNDDVPGDYCSVTYLYSERPPAMTLEIAPTAKRQVVDPKRIIYSAHWTLPIASFSFNAATLSRKNVPAGVGAARCLSFRAPIFDDFFGPPFLTFTCDLPAGRYRVLGNVVKGPEQGQVQLFQDESPIAGPVDLYQPKPEVATSVAFGEFSARDGNNPVMFKLVGKNPSATTYGFDLIDLIFERI